MDVALEPVNGIIYFDEGIVSILVLVDVALEQGCSSDFVFMVFVSILVLVDVALELQPLALVRSLALMFQSLF